MNGRIRPVADVDDAAVAAWRQLAERAAQPNPLFEPDCLVPASRHLPDGARIMMVSAEDAGRWLGCFPVAAEPAWRAIRRRVLRTHVRRMMYDGVPLLDPEWGREAASAMLHALEGAGAGITVFEWLDDGPVADALGCAAHALGMPYRTYNRWERPIVRCARDDREADPRRHHSGKWRRNQDRMLRRLSQEVGAAVELRDRSDQPQAVDLLLDMEAAGHKGQNGVAVLTQPGEATWFREMCDGFRASGRLRVYELGAGTRTLALYLLVRGGEGLFAIKASYDESFSRFSPGVQLHLAVMDHVTVASDAQWIDTCTYQGNETLLRLYPHRKRVSSTVLAQGGTADRLVLRAVTRTRTVLGRDERLEAAPGATPGVAPGATQQSSLTARAPASSVAR